MVWEWFGVASESLWFSCGAGRGFSLHKLQIAGEPQVQSCCTVIQLLTNMINVASHMLI